MQTRYFALIAGLVYVLVGIAGFVPAFRTAPEAAAPALAVETGYSRPAAVEVRARVAGSGRGDRRAA